MIRNILFIILITCTLSCYKDEGNYSYSELNEILISGIESNYHRFIGDTITISPTLKFKKAEGKQEDYNYEWFIKSEKGYGTLLTSTRNLEKFVLKGVSTGEHRMQYRVTEKSTGLQYFSEFDLIVGNDLGRGLLIMSNVDGKMKLDMISYFNSILWDKGDILKVANSDLPEQGEPFQVIMFNEQLSAWGKTLYILTSTGANRLKPLDFSYLPAYNFSNHGFGFPPNFVVEKMYNGNGRVYAYADGNIYYHNPLGYIHWTYTTPINRLENGARFKASPHCVYSNQSNGVIFNDEEKSFMLHESSKKTVSDFPQQGIKRFDTKNINKELVFIDQNDKCFYAILDSLGSRRFLACAVMYGKVGLQESYQEIYNDEMKRAKSFALPKTGNYISFISSDETKVYTCSFSDYSVKLAYQAKAGCKISHIRYLDRDLFGTTHPISTKHMLGICTYEPGVKESGEIGVMYLNPAGKFVPQQYDEKDLIWSGFGKIVSFDIKY